MTRDKLVERIARALWDADIKADSLLRSTLTAALSEARPQDAAEIYRDRARAAIAALDSAGLCIVPREPTEGMWGGLARDLVMWHDMTQPWERTPRELFKHLERAGREIPQWLRDEPEMQALDHVPSKGTRAVLIWRAMLAAAEGEAGQ